MGRLHATFIQTKPQKLALEIISIVALSLVLVTILNSFVFRFYTVAGPSMNPTLATSDRLFVNKLGPTLGALANRAFVPKRNQLVVFKNPLFGQRTDEEFIVKRVVGLPNERVIVHENHITIYNQQRPEGFNPDDGISGPQQPTSGEVDRIIPEDELFVVGDNRIGEYSMDSRNGLSTIPLRDIEGVVVFRVFPFTKLRSF